MSSKVVFSDSTYELYEGNHRDYYLPALSKNFEKEFLVFLVYFGQINFMGLINM